ncbi:MAG TPA: dienelactone hydrolase family protein [Rhizomicrobium sp.]|jgi:carboxymethylenebutenolidase|nr:dienelactone hydrolase family protein [Rhizomicrobium sp.]
MTGKDVSINTADGVFGGYLAVPGTANGAGIVVIQEIFGVNGFVRAVADSYAARGYFALAPDLFWRIEPGVQLTDKTKEEWNRAFALMNAFDIDLGVKDIQAAIDHLRGEEKCAKVGAVGYCLGGSLAHLTATRTDSDASVGYYGINIQQKLEEARNIRKPLLLHIAEKDQYVPPAAQKQIIEGLKNNPLVTIHTYPEMDHAFARIGGEHYDQANAELANGRTATFFRQHLS